MQSGRRAVGLPSQSRNGVASIDACAGRHRRLSAFSRRSTLRTLASAARVSVSNAELTNWRVLRNIRSYPTPGGGSFTRLLDDTDLRDPRARPASCVDCRSDYDQLSYELVDPPAVVAAGVRQLMARMELVYAALDFVVGPDGTWTFLEINAGGQFGWIEDETGAPLTAQLADLLTRGKQ